MYIMCNTEYWGQTPDEKTEGTAHSANSHGPFVARR